jgi:hypothetical protein
MNQNDFLNYWKYFLLIDKDLMETNPYVEHSNKNLNTYSSEFARIILVTCAEIDTICRLLCKEIDNSCDFPDDSTISGDIREYCKVILSKYPKLTTAEINITTLGYKIKPWDGWQYQSPLWWKHYRLIKHYRHTNFKKANLKNAIYALASLFVLLLYLHKTVFGFAFNVDLSEPECVMSFYILDSDDNGLNKYKAEQLPDFA